MNCAQLLVWLDQGMPEAEGAPARAHVASCARCRAALAAARELEAAFESAPIAAPRDFTERIMSRVARMPEGRPLPIVIPPPFAWWVDAAAQPSTLLATTLAALVLWQREALGTLGSSLSVALGHALIRLGTMTLAIAPPFDRPVVQLGLLLGALPPVVVACRAVFLWTERLTLAAEMRPARR